MRWLRQFWQWCRAVDAAMDVASDKYKWRPHSPIMLSAAIATIMVGVILLALAVPTLGIGLVASFGCFCATMWVWGIRMHRSWALAERHRLGLCARCGFDLRHSENNCPECGAPISNADRKHMSIAFTATEAGAVEGDRYIKAWVAAPNTRRLLSFQKSTAPHEDSEIYLVFDLEPHTTTGKITACSLTRTAFNLELTGYFNDRYEKFDVSLQISDQEWEAFARGMECLLQVTGCTINAR
jgi:hypothetical protein